MEYSPFITSIRQRYQHATSSTAIQAVAGLTGGSLFATAVGIAGSLVQAHFVTPSVLGYFRTFSIYTGYAFFLNFGIFNAFQRLYPYLRGKGEVQEAVAIAEVCQAWTVMVSAFVSVIFASLSFLAALRGDWPAFGGWAVQVVTIVTLVYGGYLTHTFRTSHDFLDVAKGSVFSTFTSTLVLPIFAIYPYVGLIMRSTVGSVANLAYLHAKRPLRVTWRFSIVEWWMLVKKGMPLFIAGYGATVLWSVTELSIISRFLGAEAVGLWSVSFMVLEAASKVPQSIVTVYDPRLTENFGKHESCIAFVKWCLEPLQYGLAFVSFMILVGWLSLPLVVPIIMPQYVSAVPVMQVMLLTLPLLLLELPNTLLVAQGKVLNQNMAVYVGLLVFVVVALVCVITGAGLVSVVVASLLGRTVRILLVFGFIFVDCRHETERPQLPSHDDR